MDETVDFLPRQTAFQGNGRKGIEHRTSNGCSVDQQNAIKPLRRAGDVEFDGHAATARCHVTAERRPGRIVQVVLELDAIGVAGGGLPGERELLSGERGLRELR